MLTSARELRRITQAALAESIGVGQPLIAKWEKAISIPNADQVTAMAKSLRVERDLFFVDRQRRLASMSDFYHRALAKAKPRDVKAMHAQCDIFDLRIDRLLNFADAPEDRLPELDIRDFGKDPEKASAEARRSMGVEAGPIPSLVKVIERCGGIVIDLGLDVEGVDALCRWVPALPKLFFINGARPADRIRFSLCHELAHTILHFGRDLDPKAAEVQADAFASAFLMPADQIRRDFKGKVTLADLAAVKRKWRVSMQAAAFRARALNVISESSYKWICIQMSRKGWRKAEPVTIPGETPRTFTRLLKLHEESGFTRLELAKLLLTDIADVDRILGDANSPSFEDHGVRLRLVTE